MCFLGCYNLHLLSLYRIRNDARLDEGGNYGSVLFQFLTECKVEDETKEHFMKYVRKQVPDKSPVNFETIFDTLKDCELIEDEKTRGLLCLVKPYIMRSGTVFIKYLLILILRHLSWAAQPINFIPFCKWMWHIYSSLQ